MDLGRWGEVPITLLPFIHDKCITFPQKRYSKVFQITWLFSHPLWFYYYVMCGHVIISMLMWFTVTRVQCSSTQLTTYMHLYNIKFNFQKASRFENKIAESTKKAESARFPVSGLSSTNVNHSLPENPIDQNCQKQKKTHTPPSLHGMLSELSVDIFRRIWFSNENLRCYYPDFWYWNHVVWSHYPSTVSWLLGISCAIDKKKWLQW